MMEPGDFDDDTLEFERESAPTYGQTQPLEADLDQAEYAEPRPTQPATWKYHNLDSSLLEFLAFLAENDVPLARIEDVTVDGDDFGQGTTMKVSSGSWLGRPVAVKRPGQVVLSKPGYILEEKETLKDRTYAFEKLLKDLMFEIRIMKHPQLAKQPNIVELIAVAFEDTLIAPKPPAEYLQSENDNWTTEIFSPILLVEPAIREHTDVSKYFKLHKKDDISPSMFASLISDVAMGLAALHALGIVHGDVKDENVLLFPSPTEGKTIVAKVADFGAAGIDTSREDVRGLSHYWAAPEAIERPPGWEGVRHTPATDVYSFGLLAATIALNGEAVFDGVDSYTTKMDDMAGEHIDRLLENAMKDRNAKITSEETTNFIQSVRRLVGITVTLDPKNRLHDLSKVPQLFSLSRPGDSLSLNGGIVPFHSYGTLAHPGIPPLASHVASTFYDKLPVALKQRIADMIQHFGNAPRDSQTMLVHLALRMTRDTTVMDSSEDLVRFLLALRLAAEDLPEKQVPLEVEIESFGGFMQMYLQVIILGGQVEPPVLQAVRENNGTELGELLSQDKRQRRAEIGNGWNGLHYAAFFNRPELMEIFLQGDNPVPIDAVARQAHRYTPLHTAAWQSNSSCVKFLLDHGADNDAKSMMTGDFSMTPLQLCIVGARDLSQRNVIKTIAILLQSGASIDFRYRGLGVAHYLAQRRGSAEALMLILQHEPDFIMQLTPNKQTPLHSAVGTRNNPVVELLLNLGADIHARNIVGDTALHNAYMSIGPSSRPSSTRYDEEFVRLLVGKEEDAKAIIRLLLKAGADPDAVGMDGIPWDTPEFRMYDEYEDAFDLCISPWKQNGSDSAMPPAPQWSFYESPGSDFGNVAVFQRGDDKMTLEFELGEITPNYYEAQICLACLDAAVQSMSVTVLIYRVVEDTAEVYMASRLALHRLDVRSIFKIKMRDFIVKHKTDLKLKLYEEVTPGRESAGPRQGRVMIDWIKISKFNILTAVGSVSSTPLEDSELTGAGSG